MPSVYNLSKLKGQYVILEVLSYATRQFAAVHLLHCTNRNIRMMLIRNYGYIQNAIPGIESKCRFTLGDEFFLQRHLGNRRFELKLLYRGSMHGFTVKAFQERCRSSPTVTLF
jgi:hypothetical protein